MKTSTCFPAVVAAMTLIAATTPVRATEAVPDPNAEIKAMTNAVERGKAWTQKITGLAKKSFPQAEALTDEAKSDLTGTQLANLYATLAVFAVQKTDDASKVKAYVNAIKSLTDATAQTDVQKKKLEDYKLTCLSRVISELTRERTGDSVLAEALYNENKALLNENQIASLTVDFLLVTVSECDRAVFDRKLAAFLAQPMSNSKVSGLMRITRAIKNLDNTLAEKLLRDALASKELTGPQRGKLLNSLADVAFNRGGEADRYRNWKSVYLEVLALADKGDIRLWGSMFPFARAFDYGDYVFADDLLKRALAVSPKHDTVLLSAAQSAFLKNDLQAAAGYLKTALENERLKKDKRDYMEALLFFAEGKPIAKFDQVFGDKPFTSADKLRLFYNVSEFLFRCDRYELCRAIHSEIINKMFLPIESKSFAVKYDQQAAKTAEGWTHTRSYRKWKGMETRFVPHGEMFDYALKTDIERHLKDAVQPEIPKGYRTGVLFLCNDEGLHIYVRADDPNVDEIVALKRNGGSFDMNFKAGAGNAPYNIWFQDLPDSTKGYIVDWAAPTKTYALARDIFKRDAVTTPEGIAAHVLIPWQYFCTQLPFDGNDWEFGMVRNVPNVGLQALTGNHQEFGRLVQLTFDLKPRERVEMKRRIATMMFNAYNRLRRDPGEFILTWKDSALGDPAFFTTTLEPLLKDLDEAGTRLTSEEVLSDKDVDDIFAEYVPLWGNIKYAVADKRAAYLRDEFMK